MNKKILLHIPLFITSILFSVISLIYSIDLIKLITDESGATININTYIICIIVSVVSCILMILSLLGLICSYFYGNYNFYRVFSWIFISTIGLLFILIIILSVVYFGGRLNFDIEQINAIIEENGESTYLENTLRKYMLAGYLKPIVFTCIIAAIPNIISFAIYYYDQTIVEEVVEETPKKNNKLNTTSENEKLENKIKEIEDKLKTKELEEKYQELLKKLETKK